jgi:glucose-1-phosphate thymidylyltransferase
MEITGWWKDTGKPEDLLEANRLVLDRMLDPGDPVIRGEVDQSSDIAGKVFIEEGARILNSEIRGPAIIGRGTVIKNSYVGPFTSIHHDCEIRNSEVEYSIFLEQVRLLDVRVRVERSLLGREVTIVGGASRPRTQRFIVGDQSWLQPE